jgi:hypothetical protein
MLIALLTGESNDAVDDFVDDLVAILLLFALIAALVLFVMIVGCVCAVLAGRGSKVALIAWAAIAVVEGVAQVLVLPNLMEELSVVLLAPAIALVAQASLYAVGRATRRGSAAGGVSQPSGPPPPPPRAW